ncbi:MAG: hypothetical protein ACFE85_07555 [Candidatus Hodarchaeota archaeon]
MGIIMITAWYPPNKSADMAKLYLKQPRQIPFVKKWRVFNCAAGKEGMKQYHLIYTEEGKAEEAGMALMKYFVPFSEMEGFNLQFESVIGVSDSYKMLGMKWE